MPKTTLYAKGKANSKQKSCKIDTGKDVETEELLKQFQLELCWCIQQLERTLCEKKNNEKQMQEIWKVLTVLKNNNQPIIRKRQLMRMHLGDYRTKMAAEEKKMVKMINKMKITQPQVKPKATYFRKSTFLSTGDNSFRFNFQLCPDQIDNGNINPSADGDNTVFNENNVNKRNVTSCSDTVLNHDNTDNTDTTSSSDNTRNEMKKFVFTFSETEFKFNFNINDDP